MSGPCHLLLVEPDQHLAEAARKMFAAYGVVAWTTADAESAIECVSHVHFDCVLVDAAVWRGMDDAELARRISWQYPKVRVALTTALDAEEVEASPEIPVFQKPYHVDAVVQSFCGGDGALR